MNILDEPETILINSICAFVKTALKYKLAESSNFNNLNHMIIFFPVVVLKIPMKRSQWKCYQSQPNDPIQLVIRFNMTVEMI